MSIICNDTHWCNPMSVMEFACRIEIKKKERESERERLTGNFVTQSTQVISLFQIYHPCFRFLAQQTGHYLLADGCKRTNQNTKRFAVLSNFNRSLQPYVYQAWIESSQIRHSMFTSCTLFRQNYNNEQPKEEKTVNTFHARLQLHK